MPIIGVDLAKQYLSFVKRFRVYDDLLLRLQIVLSPECLGRCVRGTYRFGPWEIYGFVRPIHIPYVYGFLDNIFTPLGYLVPQLGRFLIAYYSSKVEEGKYR